MIENIRLQVGIAKTIEEWQRIHNIETPDFGKLGQRDHPLRSLAAEIISEVVEFQCEPDVYGLPMDDESDNGEPKEGSAIKKYKRYFLLFKGTTYNNEGENYDHVSLIELESYTVARGYTQGWQGTFGLEYNECEALVTTQEEFDQLFGEFQEGNGFKRETAEDYFQQDVLGSAITLKEIQPSPDGLGFLIQKEGE